MHIRHWPRTERPREKLLALGAGGLSDAELLAIFLGSGLAGRDAVQTARDLLGAHGPLRALLDRDPAELARLPGLGPARACQLAAALELGNRHMAAALERGDALTDPAAAGRYFARRLRPHRREVFAALFLDTRHRVLAFEELFAGTIDGAEVHPREVARRALAHNAAAVIVTGYVASSKLHRSKSTCFVAEICNTGPRIVTSISVALRFKASRNTEPPTHSTSLKSSLIEMPRAWLSREIVDNRQSFTPCSMCPNCVLCIPSVSANCSWL